MTTTKLNPKPKRKANRRFAAAQCSAARWEIQKPLMDALLAAATKIHALAQKTKYKHGGDMVRLCADTMAKINELNRQQNAPDEPSGVKPQQTTD